MGKVNIISVIVSVTLVGLVLGLSSYNEQAEAGLSNGIFIPTEDPCDSFSGVLTHWDKILFKTNQRLFASEPPPFSSPILFPILTYDIKVEQDPISVTNLERAVSSFLNDSSYRTSDGSFVKDVFIIIVDVEYEIACVSLGM